MILSENKYLGITLLAFLCAGCASMTGSKNQPVSVTTSCPIGIVNGANCTLTNDKGQWFLQSPGSVVIQKSTEDLLVTCKKDTFYGSSGFKSKSNASVWGNVLVGGLIGYAIDSNSGAGFDYPSIMNVPLSS